MNKTHKMEQIKPQAQMPDKNKKIDPKEIEKVKKAKEKQVKNQQTVTK